MPDLNHHFSHAATVIPVIDVSRSLAFYRDQLGFKVTFSWEDPPSYAVLKAGEHVQIHLSQRPQQAEAAAAGAGTMVYIFVQDIDGLYQAYSQREVAIHTPIGDRDYGMRDFDLLDPDGNIISFGAG